ncbi:hypothetical protein P171DRAFT_443723 [Karstenula rhodostoma CBS 690.94]|uniref:Uncharacterized protein n=1 Tax=Karstenula rhodostoma CBS 690.94 TaxID=1392251 RepID=A0A9P4PIU6_9PLEO|nr:hypothetical protein P171DRAFT_443723 [Karstenula rhodostoma CBS 690.94]
MEAKQSQLIIASRRLIQIFQVSASKSSNLPLSLNRTTRQPKTQQGNAWLCLVVPPHRTQSEVPSTSGIKHEQEILQGKTGRLSIRAYGKSPRCKQAHSGLESQREEKHSSRARVAFGEKWRKSSLDQAIGYEGDPSALVVQLTLGYSDVKRKAGEANGEAVERPRFALLHHCTLYAKLSIAKMTQMSMHPNKQRCRWSGAFLVIPRERLLFRGDTKGARVMKRAAAASAQTQGRSARRVGFVYHRPPGEQGRRVCGSIEAVRFGSNLLLRGRWSSRLPSHGDGRAPAAWSGRLSSAPVNLTVSMTLSFTRGAKLHRDDTVAVRAWSGDRTVLCGPRFNFGSGCQLGLYKERPEDRTPEPRSRGCA